MNTPRTKPAPCLNASRGQQGGPTHRDLLGELRGRPRRAPDRRTLVGAEQRGRHGRREDAEQRRHQDQPAAADDGIDEAGEQRGEGDGEEIQRSAPVSGPKNRGLKNTKGARLP